ncbi:MAG TPA: 50S ribosomal protein L23 [Candidatus Paceibacterota bacterium]|nr:50S ribosomal protein L23 [Candidatus Paceibacterota bacterium]
MNKHAAHIITSPRITEKGAYLAEKGVYVFNVSKTTNKHEIAAAIQSIYKVTPRQVRVVAIPRKSVQTRGTNRWGTTRGGKKAYVYLKSGDTIELA